MERDLPLAEIEEYGHVFMTGIPVTFEFIRNNTPAPYFGSRFQQDVEPAGRYMLTKPPGWKKTDPSWTDGTIHFANPLVLAFNSDTNAEALYGETSWKAHLQRAYGGRTGHNLSRAIRKDGYDGIVTVNLIGRDKKPSFTREIVDLTVINKNLKNRLMR